MLHWYISGVVVFLQTEVKKICDVYVDLLDSKLSEAWKTSSWESCIVCGDCDHKMLDVP